MDAWCDLLSNPGLELDSDHSEVHTKCCLRRALSKRYNNQVNHCVFRTQQSFHSGANVELIGILNTNLLHSLVRGTKHGRQVEEDSSPVASQDQAACFSLSLVPRLQRRERAGTSRFSLAFIIVLRITNARLSFEPLKIV